MRSSMSTKALRSIAINFKTHQSMATTLSIVCHQENLQSANYTVICKSVYRMTKEKIMAAKRNIRYIDEEQLGFLPKVRIFYFILGND